MKTVLVTTCWLDTPEYLAKTEKWLRHYYAQAGVYLHYDEIILLDNASTFDSIGKLPELPCYLLQRFTKHLSRNSHLEYPYLWRAVYFFQELFKEYDRIIYCDNDFFLTSQDAIEYVNRIDDGWTSFHCKKHNFPETGIQIITKDCKEYQDFVAGLTEEQFIAKYNGKTMETTLPLTFVEKHLNGDRHSEYGLLKQKLDWDYSAQVQLDTEIYLTERED